MRCGLCWVSTSAMWSFPSRSHSSSRTQRLASVPWTRHPGHPAVQVLLVAGCSLVGSGVRHEHPHVLWPPHRATYYFSSRPVTFRPPSRLPTNHGASHHCPELGISNPGHFSPHSTSTASSAVQSSVQPCKAARVGMECSKSTFSSHTSVVSVRELGFGFLLLHSCMQATLC